MFLSIRDKARLIHYRQLLDEEFIHLVCKPERARELKANAGLNTIPTLSRVIRSLQTRSKCPGGASIHLRTITKEVASRCVLYIKGDYLCVKLPSGNESEKGMRALLEYCHFAHVLCIRQLMRASMHALITAIFRRPDMWSNHETNTKLVEEIGLFSDKPAKKLLLHTFKSAIPLLVECNWTDGLPHDSYVVRDIFRMDEKACGKLWVDGKMRVGYAERPQASSAPNGGRKRSVKPMNSGGYGRYNAWDPGY